ncbi:DUF4123 domain-containing protein [Salmonella bongori serovar 40:z35:-]|uniref:DUF4123 domain-containing protein n=1 Tax=Salmonella bongori TaxID=54736 RepID=UPI0019C02BAE|nr:DUF4123 domain-containing protein [Salmonella bongori]EGE4656931.1 DUF4123 domain-containing protein [Salmonella bongori serovar 40:z35:- str. 95-0123]QVP38082.1 DUF4123 domain-containing protein [Salmonella bongori serovar 40:z35:-]
MEITPVQYAIVDGAVEESLLDFLHQNNPPYCCLFPPPVQPDLIGISPYLLEVTQEVASWLTTKETPWGIYFYSYNKIHLLVQHFRNYLWANIPEQSKPVLFRFYDPRNIWVWVNALTPLELYKFIEPVTRIITEYQEEKREDDFSALRQSVKKNITKRNNTMLTFTQRQYNLLNRQAQKNYIKTLELYIHKYYTEKGYPIPKEVENNSYCAEYYFNLCHSLNINDDRSIRGVIYLLLENKIYNDTDIPHEWIDILNNNEAAVHRQVEMLLLDKLGFIPQ